MASKGRTTARVVRTRQSESAPAEVEVTNRRALLARLGCGALALLLAACLYFLLTAPAFAVARVESSGQSLLTREEIAQAAAVLGTSVFGVDKERVAGAVARLGTVRSVEAEVALPNVVRIQIKEYEPRYLWQTAAETYYVDERGVVLGAARSQPSLPAVRESAGAARKRGDKVDLAALQGAARLAKVWPASLGTTPVCEFGLNGLTLVGEGWRADLGSGVDLEAQVLALGAVLRHVKGADEPVSYVDLRVPNRPYYK